MILTINRRCNHSEAMLQQFEVTFGAKCYRLGNLMAIKMRTFSNYVTQYDWVKYILFFRLLTRYIPLNYFFNRFCFLIGLLLCFDFWFTFILMLFNLEIGCHLLKLIHELKENSSIMRNNNKY